MFKLAQFKCVAPALMLGAVALLAHGCKVDDRYSLENIKNVDTEVTVFSNGLTLPLVQNTARFTVDSLMDKVGLDDTSLGDYLKTDENGAYYVSYETHFSLKESLQSLNLKDLVDIPSVNYSQKVNYELSSIDASSLETDAQSFKTADKLELPTFTLGSFDPVTTTNVILNRSDVNDAATAASRVGMTNVTLSDVEMEFNSNDNKVKGTSLSDKIDYIDEINMKNGSKIKVEASLKGSIFTSGRIVPDVKIDMGDVLELADRTGSLDCSTLVLQPSNSFSASRTFDVAKLNASKLTQDRTVGVSGKILATSLATTVSAAAGLSSDVKVEIKLSFVNFEVESVYGKLKDMSYDLNDEGETVSIDLPDEVNRFGAFTIMPKGNPAISLSLQIPEIDGIKIEAKEDVKLQIPEILRLKNMPEGFEYDEASNTVIIKDIKSGDHRLPVDRIVVNPKKVGDKYVAEGKYSVKCSLGLPDERMDIYKLNSLNGKNFSIACEIPAIEAGEIILDELSIDVEEKSGIELISAADIPDMVKSLGTIKLNETTADLNLDLRNLPDIGDGRFYLDLKADLPDFVVPSTMDLSGEIIDGKFSKSIDIEKLDFSKVDLERLRSEGGKISGDVTVSGTLKASKPSIDIDKISQAITGEIVMKISGKDGKVDIEDISAKVDYQIDSSLTVDFFELPEEIQNSSFDFPNAELVATVKSNLAIPMNAKLDLNDGMFNLDMQFPYSENPSEFKTVENKYSLDMNPLISESKEKLPVKFSMTVPGDKDSHVNPNADYDMDIDLGIKIPVAFGNDCNVTYSRIVSIGSNASTIARVLEKTPMQFFGTVGNSTPFRVSVKAELLSYGGGAYTVIPTSEPIESIVAEPDGKNDFAVNVKVPSGTNLDGLSHVRLTLTLGANGSQLNETDYVLLEDLGFKAPEGVTVDVTE
jgi:hypothetical protein